MVRLLLKWRMGGAAGAAAFADPGQFFAWAGGAELKSLRSLLAAAQPVSTTHHHQTTHSSLPHILPDPPPETFSILPLSIHSFLTAAPGRTPPQSW